MTLYAYLIELKDFFFQFAVPEAARWLFLVAVVMAPILLVEYAWYSWKDYTRRTWITNAKKVLLEIKLPQETFKSPAAMELVLNALIQTGGEGTRMERYWEGKTRVWTSLELVSLGGQIHFYIWAFANQKDFLMANIYAQYPDIAIFEVSDYTDEVCQNRDKYDIWGIEYTILKPDPYPIKTYIDYGLGDDPDEELKIDPLAPLIEALGSVRAEDQVWWQFVVRAHRAEPQLFGKGPDTWKDDVKKEIKKIHDEAFKDDKSAGGSIVVPNTAKLTEGAKDVIKALERSIAKFSFDVGIRAINVVPKGKTGNINRGLLKGGFRQFGSNNLNSIIPGGTDFDHWWEDPFGTRLPHWKEFTFRSYCLRSFFHPPYRSLFHGVGFFSVHNLTVPTMVLNTEEMATLYHFPGSTVKTPTLQRIPSKRANPPANLPI